MTFLEKLDYLMDKNDLNKRRLSLNSGIPYSTIDSWYKIGYERMKLPTFGKLCEYFGVDMESMAFDDLDIVYVPAAGSPGNGELSDEARAIGRAYDMADEGIKNSVAKLLDVKKEDTIEKEAPASA